MMSPGIKLRMLREQQGLLQREVAEAVGVGSKTYSAYEGDRKTPSQPVKERLSQFYGVPVEQLFSARNNDKLSEEWNPQSGETYKEYKLRVFPRYQGVNIRPRKGVEK